MLSRFLWVLAVLVLPGAAFYGGYTLTDWVFRRDLIPLPFESFGWAAGAGCFFWTLSILMLFGKRKKRGGSS